MIIYDNFMIKFMIIYDNKWQFMTIYDNLW